MLSYVVVKDPAVGFMLGVLFHVVVPGSLWFLWLTTLSYREQQVGSLEFTLFLITKTLKHSQTTKSAR